MLTRPSKDKESRKLNENEEKLKERLNRALKGWCAIFNILGSIEAKAEQRKDRSSKKIYDGLFERTFKYLTPQKEWYRNIVKGDHPPWGAMFRNILYKAFDGVLINELRIEIVPLVSPNTIPLPDGRGEDYRRDINYRIYADILFPTIEVAGEYRVFIGSNLFHLKTDEEIIENTIPYDFRYIFKEIRFKLRMRLTQIDERFVILDRWLKKMIRFTDLIFSPLYQVLSDEDVEVEILPRNSPGGNSAPISSPVSPDGSTGTTEPLTESQDGDSETKESIASHVNGDTTKTSQAPEPVYTQLPSESEKSDEFGYTTTPPNRPKPSPAQPSHELIAETISYFSAFVKNNPTVVSQLLEMNSEKIISPQIQTMSSIYDLFGIFKSLLEYKLETPNVEKFEDFFYQQVSTKSAALKYIENAVEPLTSYLTSTDEARLENVRESVKNNDSPVVSILDHIFDPDLGARLKEMIKSTSRKSSGFSFSALPSLNEDSEPTIYELRKPYQLNFWKRIEGRDNEMQVDERSDAPNDESFGGGQAKENDGGNTTKGSPAIGTKNDDEERLHPGKESVTSDGAGQMKEHLDHMIGTQNEGGQKLHLGEERIASDMDKWMRDHRDPLADLKKRIEKGSNPEQKQSAITEEIKGTGGEAQSQPSPPPQQVEEPPQLEEGVVSASSSENPVVTEPIQSSAELGTE